MRLGLALFSGRPSDNRLFPSYYQSNSVELLDLYFGNVCELDIVWYFHKVYALVDEFFLAGEIEETSKQAIIGRLKYLESLD